MHDDLTGSIDSRHKAMLREVRAMYDAMSTREYDHAILFTGHMIDAWDRKIARFPAAAETMAGIAIANAVSLLQKSAATGETFIGIAGGASGGDLLFHEACARLQIRTRLLLGLPVERYIEASVAPAGPGWVGRFEAIVTRLGRGGVRVMDVPVGLPVSLTGGAPPNLWQQTNLWMIQETLAIAPQRTLIALWDGKPGDGLGGTADLVRVAHEFGIDVAPIIPIPWRPRSCALPHGRAAGDADSVWE